MPLVVLLAAQCAVGSAALLARLGMSNGMDGAGLALWRLTVASLLLLVWQVASRWSRPGQRSLGPSRDDTVRLLFAGVLLACHFWTWLESLAYVPVYRSVLLVSTTPVWAGIGHWAAYRVLPSRRYVAGVAVALAGCYLVVRYAPGDATGWAPTSANTRLGDGLAVVGAGAIAAYMLLVAPVTGRLGTWTIVSWTYPAAALTLWLCAGIAGSTVAAPSNPMAWLAVAGMALVPQLLGHTGMNWSLRRFGPTVVGASTLMEPVFASALAWVLLAEAMASVQVFGAVILLVGILACIWTAPASAPNNATASLP